MQVSEQKQITCDNEGDCIVEWYGENGQMEYATLYEGREASPIRDILVGTTKQALIEHWDGAREWVTLEASSYYGKIGIIYNDGEAHRVNFGEFNLISL